MSAAAQARIGGLDGGADHCAAIELAGADTNSSCGAVRSSFGAASNNCGALVAVVVLRKTARITWAANTKTTISRQHCWQIKWPKHTSSESWQVASSNKEQ